MISAAKRQAHQNSAQKFGTTGIKPLERPSLITRFFMRVVAGAERLNVALSKVGNPPIYDKSVFPWARTIEHEWRGIRAELDRVLTRKEELPAFHELATDVSTISKDRGWKTFLLSGFRLTPLARPAEGDLILRAISPSCLSICVLLKAKKPRPR